MAWIVLEMKVVLFTLRSVLVVCFGSCFAFIYNDRKLIWAVSVSLVPVLLYHARMNNGMFIKKDVLELAFNIHWTLDDMK